MTMITRYALLALVGLAFALPAQAAPKEDIDLPVDGRIKLLEYNPNDIYTVYARVGYQSYIEFAPQEEIETISVGDRSFWQLIPSGNRLFVRPQQTDTTTNMTVITNRRSYQFDLKSVGEKDKNVTYVARFVYPQKLPPAPPIPPAPTAEMAPPPPPVMESAPPAPPPAGYAEPSDLNLPPPPPESGKRNYLYTYAGPDNVAPYEVYDDGRNTFIRYRDTSRSMPQVAVVGKGGRETPVAASRQGEYIVVGQVAPQLALRYGTNTVYVYNEMLVNRP